MVIKKVGALYWSRNMRILFKAVYVDDRVLNIGEEYIIDDYSQREFGKINVSITLKDVTNGEATFEVRNGIM